ncbi:S8 family serine peptidase [Paraburkholderia sp. GAS348]|uniref:S8 family serine peptidase n=1 Tax=Paraburkholderia sp. GAS348 TaxID=3035132 RepID=UPI003D2561D1
MRTERHEAFRVEFQKNINKVGLRSKSTVRRMLAGAACFSLLLALTACGGDGEGNTVSKTTPTTISNAEVAAAASAAGSNTVPLAMSLKMNTSGLTSDESNDRFIVKYKTGTAERGSTSAVKSRLDRLASAFPAKARHLRRMGIGADVVTTERKLNGKDARAFMRAIASDPNVEYVEVDAEMHTDMIPSDADYGMQWGFTPNEAANNQIGGIRAERAWDISNGSGVVIAMLDNGVTSHSDLDANILPGYDFTGSNPGGNGSNPGITTEKCSVSWHGTHVAGILAAVTNNGKGVAGTAWGAKVVPVRVLNGCGSGLMSNVADGITWASGGSVDGVPANPLPAKVINLSLGGNGSCSRTYQNAINDAVNRGVSVVVASGNDNLNASFYQPGNCLNVIVVSGHNADGTRVSDANYGSIVDISAPGANIWSTWNYGTATPTVSDAYIFQRGTSMATPFVSGVIALAQAAAPKPLTPAEMRNLLMQNARAFPVGAPDQPRGAGMLDAAATIAAARSGKIPMAANFTCSQSDQLMQVTCVDLSTARGSSIRSWVWNFGDSRPDRVSTQSVNPTVWFDQPGTYEFTLTVTDGNGAVSRLIRRFNVVPPTVTDITDYWEYGVKFGADPNKKVYFSLQLYPMVEMVGPLFRTVDYTLIPGSSSQVAKLDMKIDSLSMENPDCSSVASGGQAVTCHMSGMVGTQYALVSSNTGLDGAVIKFRYGSSGSRRVK